MHQDTPTKKTLLAWVALCAGLLATALVGLKVKEVVEQDAVNGFSYASDQITLKIRDRLAAQELILHGGAGLFATEGEVTRSDWRHYWEALKPELILPGVLGFGFAQLIPPDRLAAHVEQVRREGFPDYDVHPHGEREVYSSIVYLEPFNGRNLRAFGFDMFSEPVRHEAMAHARDTGNAALSGKVELVQETDTGIQPGVLMYVPVYRQNMPTETVDQRQAALIGWSYSPYRMVDLMNGILQDWQQRLGRDIHLAIYDGLNPTGDARLYASQPGATETAPTIFRQQRSIAFNDHHWLLVFERDPAALVVDYSMVWITLAGCLLISILLTRVVWSLLNTRYQAHRLARKLTRDIRQHEQLLRDSEYRWNFALDGSGLGVWDWDVERKSVFYSGRWKEMLGYAEQDIGDAPNEWEKRIHPDDRARTLARLQSCVDGRASKYESEYRLRHKDGHYVWVHDRGMVITRREDGRALRMIGTHSDITERMQSVLRIQQLARLYAALSECNAAIVHCTSRSALFERICQVVVDSAGMRLAWIGLVEEASGKVMPLSAYGEKSGEFLKNLDVSVREDEPLGQGVVGTAIRENRLVWLEDFREQSCSEPWRERLLRYDLVSAASLPIRRAGKPVGALTFYSAEAGFSDPQMQALFQNMANQIGFALDKLDTEVEARTYQQSVLESGQRLQKVFDAAPVPMQIHSSVDFHISSINLAHRQWLGYPLKDISGKACWFEQVYESEAEREKFKTLFTRAMEKARLGLTVNLSERTLRCKDGSLRVAVATMTMVGEDIILAWTDLTEIRRSEQALRDSEQRFRNMVEQSISGMYVRRDDRFIYVNPRFCEMTGWSAEELLEQPIIKFTTDDADNRAQIFEAWTRVEAGERNVAYHVPLRRKNGEIIELGLNATTITWDDGLPAAIVMAQDITERRRAEEQIAAYVKQLEGSMHGTLRAVSNMVELRDPYTAGHERRVGLIASAIAREMGWSAERCDNLEMIGLVHDIGKIAVPSEILTKPGRLTPLEMELMKGHAQAGYEILKDVPFAAPVAEAIWQHHERMDGHGYPRGLKGDEILPEARVLAVADVLESMASHRPYRPALGLEVALKEVEQGKGKLYDPEVVDAVVRLVKEKGYVMPQ